MYKIASLIIATIVLVSCSHGNKDGNAGKALPDTTSPDGTVQLTADQAKNAGIVTGVPQRKELHKTLKVAGVIDVPPENVISVSIPLGGYVKKMSLIPGQNVNRGETLATIEDPQFVQLQQDYLTAKSKLAYFEAEYLRQQKLNETKAASDKVYQQAKSDFETEKILLKSIGEKLQLIGIDPGNLTESSISRRIDIKSPISGYVTKVNINPGKYVSPTDVLFELVNPNDLHLTLTVFENDAAALLMGQKLVCYTNAHPGKKYGATIHLINPSIGKDRATEVHCHIDGYGKELLPGMYMNGEIELNNIAANTLPEDAVVKWNNKYYLFAEVSTNKYKMLQVEPGETDEGYVEIKSALADEKIVIKNAYTLLMKMKNTAEE
jgi:membrane fusion protein, heavy metal efflux system